MICEKCKKVYENVYGSGRFCSRACANSRVRTDEIKSKISESLMGHVSTTGHTYKKNCVICQTEFTVPGRKKNRVSCSDACSAIRKIQVMSMRGRNSAASQQRRSKNETEFAELCKSKFSNVLVNNAVFDGWDADVILPDYKIAILWNGPWHYRKITEKHSLEQVQNRDRLKLKAIERYGYKSYIIKDMGSHNPTFVASEFEKFLRWIS